jgi:hypothetical protein
VPCTAQRIVGRGGSGESPAQKQWEGNRPSSEKIDRPRQRCFHWRPKLSLKQSRIVASAAPIRGPKNDSCRPRAAPNSRGGGTTSGNTPLPAAENVMRYFLNQERWFLIFVYEWNSRMTSHSRAAGQGARPRYLFKQILLRRIYRTFSSSLATDSVHMGFVSLYWRSISQ